MQTLRLEHRFTSSLGRVWRVIGDTERFNKAAGLPPVIYRDEPQPDGTSRRFCSSHKLGVEMEYEELPFRWPRFSSPTAPCGEPTTPYWFRIGAAWVESQRLVALSSRCAVMVARQMSFQIPSGYWSRGIVYMSRRDGTVAA